ncbi:VOC family protein [Croceicoccus naphthovorans]|uniref:Uncharacterized protein n=1 Tax=Croceicoccus naphthovorans TaxID=1348774 RepID=A0A0G3XCG0_9SPHN|nr:VOC family protein [Croceicoccus naphthovorans]AKM09240.1 hypothetical protein AB433_03445 [Croceicoccus naphthovorans]MBB3990372.1 hypothetical protein [Croceicoccus naphthovorans]
MANQAGEPIWYELLSDDLSKVAPFYEAVVGWSIEKAHMAAEGGTDYYFLKRADNDATGGAMTLADSMKSCGMKPRWLAYFATPDVDTSVAKLKELGGSVTMDPFDLPGVGRMAYVADPQGIPFYLMTGASPERSEVFAGEDRNDFGKCGWNELLTSDAEGAIAFYGALTGMAVNERMPMGEMGDYSFLDVNDLRIGAVMKAVPEGPMAQFPIGPHCWHFYFRVPNVTAAKAAIESNGGTVLMGPMEVPGGEHIVVALDPDGANFGLVGPLGE